MEDLDKLFIKLVEVLKERDIIAQNIEFIGILSEKTENLRNVLKEKFANIKLPQMMKSIHYTNYFQDENLKLSAFILDEIEQYLFLNDWINHDENVDFFNDKITKEGFIITPKSMVETAIESLIVNIKNNSDV